MELILSRNFNIPDAWKISVAESRGAYQTARKVLTSMKPAEVTSAVTASNLRGLGGAGFPTGKKWQFLPKSPPAEGGSASGGKIKVTDLELSARITSALTDAGIKSAAGLARKTASALKELDGIGEKAIEEISVALAGHGLTLKGE